MKKEKQYYCDKMNNEETDEEYKKRFFKMLFITFLILTPICSLVANNICTNICLEFSLSTSIMYLLSILGGIASSLIMISIYLLMGLIAIPISYIHKGIDRIINFLKEDD